MKKTNKHTITEFKDWPEGLEVCFHDWVINGTKEEITKKLGFKPVYKRTGNCTYTWKCNLDNGRYFFTIYDMSYGRRLGKNDVIEYHIGFDCTYDDIRIFYPTRREALEMLEALLELDLDINHSSAWKWMHDHGIVDMIDKKVKESLYGSNTEFHN